MTQKYESVGASGNNYRRVVLATTKHLAAVGGSVPLNQISVTDDLRSVVAKQGASDGQFWAVCSQGDGGGFARCIIRWATGTEWVPFLPQFAAWRSITRYASDRAWP